ncbi:MAG: hypothetical protein AAF689_12250 [Pseudomonadota bacterium]
MSDRIIARLTPTPARRATAAIAPGGLGGVILWLAVQQPAQSAPFLGLLLVIALVCLGLAYRAWRATATYLELTPEVLREATGRELCQLADVARVESSLLSWKPAGGFAVHLKTPAGRAWAPGLWWRLGRRVMVGGATNSGEAKAMADLMRIELARQAQK